MIYSICLALLSQIRKKNSPSVCFVSWYKYSLSLAIATSTGYILSILSLDWDCFYLWIGYAISDFYSFFSLVQPDIMQCAAGLIGICAANKFRDFGQWNTSNILCYSPGLFSHPANAFSCLSCISQLNTSLWTCSFLLFFAAIFNSDFRTVAIGKEILMHICHRWPSGTLSRGTSVEASS